MPSAAKPNGKETNVSKTVPTIRRFIFPIAFLLLCAATDVWADDDIVPFDPSAPFWDGVLYVWNFLKDLI